MKNNKLVLEAKFKDIQPGEFFATAGKILFVKTSNKEFNAIKLSNGNLENIQDSVQVSSPRTSGSC